MTQILTDFYLMERVLPDNCLHESCYIQSCETRTL